MGACRAGAEEGKPGQSGGGGGGPLGVSSIGRVGLAAGTLEPGRASWSYQRPYIIETMHSYTLPM